MKLKQASFWLKIFNQSAVQSDHTDPKQRKYSSAVDCARKMYQKRKQHTKGFVFEKVFLGMRKVEFRLFFVESLLAWYVQWLPMLHSFLSTSTP